MKKILTFVSIVVLAVSCAKDPIFKTEAVDMCGQWYVTCDAVDASGNVVLEDPDLFGEVLLREGDLIVVAPEDAHKPRCAAGEPAPVKKVVVKVKI